MTYKEELFTGASAGTTIATSNTNFNSVVKSAGSTFQFATGNAVSGAGTKSARVTISADADLAYGLWSGYSVGSMSIRVGVIFNALPFSAGSPGSTSRFCKLISPRASSQLALGSIRFGGTATNNGNVWQITNQAGTVLATSGLISVGAEYVLELAGTVGTTTSNGTLRARVWENGVLMLDVPVSSTANTGTVNVDSVRIAKSDAVAPFDGWVSIPSINDGINTYLGLPVAVTATANAGPDALLQPFANIQAGDGLVARAQLDSSQTVYQGGTPSYNWTVAAQSGTFAGQNASFTSSTAANPQLIIPQPRPDQGIRTDIVSLTVTVGTVTSTDTCQVITNPCQQLRLEANGTTRTAVREVVP